MSKKNNIDDAVNNDFRLRGIAKRLIKSQCTLTELNATERDMMDLKGMGYNVISHETPSGSRVYYIATFDQNPYLFISGLCDKKVTLKWVEMADLHGGCIQFREDTLRELLSYATKHGYKDVHIAGDVCDGIDVYSGHMNELKYTKVEDQAGLMTSIFRDYDLNYYVTKGNHDFSFEKKASISPIKLIEQDMKRLGKNFVFFNSYAADIIIAGVVKRMIHLSGGSAYAKSYPAQVYIRNLMDSNGEMINIGNKKYRIRFLQCGHFHTDVAFESAGIKVTHPGNTQDPNSFTIRKGLVGPKGARFTKVTIQNGEVIKYTSDFVSL